MEEILLRLLELNIESIDNVSYMSSESRQWNFIPILHTPQKCPGTLSRRNSASFHHLRDQGNTTQHAYPPSLGTSDNSTATKQPPSQPSSCLQRQHTSTTTTASRHQTFVAMHYPNQHSHSKSALAPPSKVKSTTKRNSET